MYWVSIGLVVILVPLILSCLRSLAAREHEAFGHVRMPTSFAVLGCLGWLVSTSFLVAYMHWLKGIFLAVSIAALITSALFCIIYCSIRITYDESGFRVKKFWGKPKFHFYGEISSIIPGGTGATTICLKEGKVFLDGLTVGKDSFLDYAEQQYCSLHDTLCIPDQRPRLFHGNVTDPWAILFPIVLLWVFMLGMYGVILNISIRDVLLTQEDLTFEEVYISSVQPEDKSYRLNDGRFRILKNTDSERAPDELLHTAVVLGYDAGRGDGVNHPYNVWMIVDADGEEFYGFAEHKAQNTRAAFTVYVAMFFILIAIAALCGLGYYVLCNAERYPKAAALLVKPEYRNW